MKERPCPKLFEQFLFNPYYSPIWGVIISIPFWENRKQFEVKSFAGSFSASFNGSTGIQSQDSLILELMLSVMVLNYLIVYISVISLRFWGVK